MNLYQWAAKWAIPIAALDDLQREFRTVSTDPPNVLPPPGSEAMVQSIVRLEATHKHKRLFRNNVGAGMLDNGSFLRWGLANDSKGINDACKSADLIGISGELITAADIGQPRGRFVAREIKVPGWQYSGAPREVAQLRFLELIAAYGGDAAFATGAGTL